MIVYGDRERLVTVPDAFDALEAQVLRCSPSHGGRERELACSLAIECGVLVQGLLDREHEARGVDALTAMTEAAAALSLACGKAFDEANPAHIRPALEALHRAAPRAGSLRLREPEGYAFYALYPEQYVAAARALSSRIGTRDVQVIGIRSIGSSLAGFVAATLRTTRLPFSVRPGGHPFARTLAVDDALAARLLTRTDHTYFAIVDEGPGLSGSSFVAGVEWLVARGVDPTKIVLFPSHAGEPGGQASEPVRARYRSTPRAFVPFDECFPPDVLGAWFRDHTGPLAAPLRDLSGGRWRALQSVDSARWPPSHVRDERRKYLLEAAGGESYLMKYVGIGSDAARIVGRARELGAEGLTPTIESWHHGFVLMPWYGAAIPLPHARFERAAFLDHLGHYLGTLAARFGNAPADSGAEPAALLSLLKHNTAQLLGDDRAGPLARFDGALPRLRERHRPTATDNKLDAHEWLVLPDGRFLKTDAEAHHAAHDCIGCQDPAWDLAGATLELALTPDEQDALGARLFDAARVRIDDETKRFYELSYAAFRAGVAHYAVLALEGWAEDDAARFRAEKARYTAMLEERLSGP